MDKKSITSTNNIDFRNSIPEYSDEEILKILRRRKLYQPEAADLALQEAIKRELINSEQDLFDEEFRETQTSFQLFPTIESQENRVKIRKSIARGLLVVGVIPSIWGILEIKNNNLFEGLLLTLLGGIWIFAAFKIMRGIVAKMISILFVMLIASVAYIIKLMLELKGLRIMDYAIPFILFLLIIYGLLYVRKLGEHT